jgi:hypothetical protein
MYGDCVMSSSFHFLLENAMEWLEFIPSLDAANVFICGGGVM